MMTTRGEFSVYCYFPDGTWEDQVRFVTVEEAMRVAERLTRNVGARLGTTRRVIITDGGDDTVWEWQHGKGITWPLEAS
jgi:hypothetical protein